MTVDNAETRQSPLDIRVAEINVVAATNKYWKRLDGSVRTAVASSLLEVEELPDLEAVITEFDNFQENRSRLNDQREVVVYDREPAGLSLLATVPDTTSNTAADPLVTALNRPKVKLDGRGAYDHFVGFYTTGDSKNPPLSSGDAAVEAENAIRRMLVDAKIKNKVTLLAAERSSGDQGPFSLIPHAKDLGTAAFKPKLRIPA